MSSSAVAWVSTGASDLAPIRNGAPGFTSRFLLMSLLRTNTSCGPGRLTAFQPAGVPPTTTFSGRVSPGLTSRMTTDPESGRTWIGVARRAVSAEREEAEARAIPRIDLTSMGRTFGLDHDCVVVRSRGGRSLKETGDVLTRKLLQGAQRDSPQWEGSDLISTEAFDRES